MATGIDVCHHLDEFFFDRSFLFFKRPFFYWPFIVSFFFWLFFCADSGLITRFCSGRHAWSVCLSQSTQELPRGFHAISSDLSPTSLWMGRLSILPNRNIKQYIFEAVSCCGVRCVWLCPRARHRANPWSCCAGQHHWMAASWARTFPEQEASRSIGRY